MTRSIGSSGSVHCSGSNEITTQWQFDKNSRLTKAIDARSNETTFEYDALDRTTREVYADSGAVLYYYDVNSNILTRQDQNTTKVFYKYNLLSLLTKKTFSIAANHIQGETTEQEFTYDALNRLVTAEGTNSKILYTYNTVSGVESEEMITVV